MEIATGQVANHRRLMAFGYELVDITAKSGLHWFAPDYDDVMRYKHGELDEAEYTERYLGKMRHTFRTHHGQWQALKDKEKVCFMCYCRSYREDGTLEFCHRHIFVNLLTKYLDREGVAYTLVGELR